MILLCGGELFCANAVATDAFHADFQKCMLEKELKSDQMYNADKSGLCWKGLPIRTLAFEKEKCVPGHKSSKVCFMVMI
jgi:hypothetical protein